MRGVFFAALVGSVLSLGWNDELTLTQVESLDLKSEFGLWAKAFSKSYPDLDEEAHRYNIWLNNLNVIAESNSLDLSYKLRLNQFGDLTTDEFRHYVHGPTGSCVNTDLIEKPIQDKVVLGREQIVNANPASVDWTTQGVVTPVKNQGQCGSCWAFSATGAMECDYAIAHGTLTSLSEQQLVDCSGAYGNYGCSGGWYYSAWQYAYKDGGLCTEAEYSYTGRDGTCKDSTCGTKYDLMESSIDTKVTADSDSAMENAAAAGCVSVAIEADQTAFQYYSSGVLTGTCGTSIDHAVLVVGYGTMSGTEYWKVKNSWGTSWGEQGYVLICRNCNKNGNMGECGINMYPYVPNY
jgi:C1A family cysteine protease